MKERSKKLKEMIEGFLRESFVDQYGIADFVDSGKYPKLNDKMDKLSSESAFYQRILKQLDDGKAKQEFEVKRLTNHSGNSHLIVITHPAIEKIEIGTVVIIHYADGFIDPKKVILAVDNKGMPLRVNEKFAMVTKYIYN